MNSCQSNRTALVEMKLFLVEVKMRNRDGKQIYRSRQGFTSARRAAEAEFELKKLV